MSEKVTLSYVLTTKNKLPYLREVMSRLIQARQSDEEIVVVDGASTDGTAEYLKGLHQDQKIQYYLSEPDCGESHGLNKALLAARGKLLKIITSDDAYHYPTIKLCKAFMLANPQIDLLTTEAASLTYLNAPFHISIFSFRSWFEEWQRCRQPVPLPCLGMIIRRSSLALTGLFHTDFIAIDAEYARRVTAGLARLAFYTGHSFVGIPNPSSNQKTFAREIEKESLRLDLFYGKHHAAGRPSDVTRVLFQSTQNTSRWLRAILRKVVNPPLKTARPPEACYDFGKAYERCLQWLNERYREPNEFLSGTEW